jgi:peroxiredoxin Q/BCP
MLFNLKMLTRIKPKETFMSEATTAPAILAEGDLAPNFTTTTPDGETIQLSDYRGKTVVLYFYPRDNTPGCTQQAIEFEQQKDDLASKNCVILGLSRDTNKSHLRFSAKHDLSFTLIADSEEDICNTYGVMKQKNMFGKKVKGIERSTFIIDPNGKILKIWRKVKVPGHVDSVVEYIGQLL